MRKSLAGGPGCRRRSLTGRVILVTGGRVGIGHRVALKFLRAGGSVVVTSRFPCDAALRFARAADFAIWADRLAVHGLDLRDIGAVERFAGELSNRLDRLDALVNNAAQTVRRPAGYYAKLVEAEYRGPDALPARVAAVVERVDHHAAGRLAEPFAVATAPPTASAALLARLELAPEDALPIIDGSLDAAGGLVDARPDNSWTRGLADIGTVELIEVHAVNAIAPFVLLRGLLPALRRSPAARRFVVNVTSQEGRIDAADVRGIHPHTNMTKAALNQSTRRVAGDLATERIFVTAVDPGWVSDQRPASASGGFVTPLTAEDGAARVAAPVFHGLTDPATPASGVLFKDFEPVPW